MVPGRGEGAELVVNGVRGQFCEINISRGGCGDG